LLKLFFSQTLFNSRRPIKAIHDIIFHLDPLAFLVD
jgi:hypothetical protein